MPDRPYRDADDLIRRVQRVAANRPDPMHILAETISLIGESDVDPYAIVGVLIEGAVHRIDQHVPAERQAETAATVLRLLELRLSSHGLHSGDE
jgi:hypothetical protein